MNSYKITLEAFTGARTYTYVITHSKKQAMKIAENRVNKKSPNGWKSIDCVLEEKPNMVIDNWNK